MKIFNDLLEKWHFWKFLKSTQKNWMALCMIFEGLSPRWPAGGVRMLTRGQASVRIPKKPPDFWFSNRHGPTQDLIALGFLNVAFPTQSFPKTLFEGVRCKLFFHCSIAYWNCSKGQLMCQIVFFNWFYYWYCSKHDLLKFHFSYSQLGYKGKNDYRPTQFSVAFGYRASG